MPELVGEWQGRHDCAVIREILIDYGFADFVNETVVSEGLIPGVSDPEELRDPEHPCRDAESELHWHFFRPDGTFGSLDKNREQVDDGSYVVVDAHRFEVSGAPFDYEITGNSLTMRPAALGQEECTPGEWCDDIWMLMVSLPGTTWTRSD